MLCQINRDRTLAMLSSLEPTLRTRKVIVTSSEEMYAKVKKDKELNVEKVIYGNSLGGIQPKTFGLAFVEQFVITTDISLMKISSIVNGGVIFPYTLPWSLEKFIDNVELQKDSLRKDETIRKERERLKELHKKKMEAYKEEKKQVKAHNKELKKEYEKALKEAPDSVKAFIKEPEYLPEPEKPGELILPEFKKAYSLHMDRQNESYGWKLLSRFEFFQIEDSSFGYLRKRPEMLKFSIDNAIEVAKIGKMSKGEFYEEIAKLDVDTPKVADIKQSLIEADAIALVAQFDETMSSLYFSEESEGVKEVKLPPLAPIKPMHAASMLAGGIGEYSKEIDLNGEKHLIKAAIVKTFSTRKILMGTREIEETVEFYEQKMGVYNLDRRELRILG